MQCAETATPAAACPPQAAARQPAVLVRVLGRTMYAATFTRMREFTDARNAATPDEIWLTEHAPVYTLGLAGQRAHLLDAGDIPVVASDRGGQITYHGPGQLIAYLLIDLHRRAIKVRELVRLVEAALIETLAAYGIAGERQSGMPGVYVTGAKIAALGLKVKRGCCYHGASLNVDLDLAPFCGINPCGYAGLASTSIKSLGVCANLADAGLYLAAHLQAALEQPATRGA